MNKKHCISSHKIELGDYYRQEAESFGDYKGQYGYKTLTYHNDDGELKQSHQPVINFKQAKKKFYGTLNIDKATRQAIKVYNQVKNMW